VVLTKVFFPFLFGWRGAPGGGGRIVSMRLFCEFCLFLFPFVTVPYLSPSSSKLAVGLSVGNGGGGRRRQRALCSSSSNTAVRLVASGDLSLFSWFGRLLGAGCWFRACGCWMTDGVSGVCTYWKPASSIQFTTSLDMAGSCDFV